MSAQTISDVLSIALNKAMTSKLAAYVNTFSYKLSESHGFNAKELVALWNEVNQEMPIKYKKEDTKKEKKEKNTCPYVAEAGKNKGVPCGKGCKEEFCSAHKPEKMAKDKAKRAAKKTEGNKDDKNDKNDKNDKKKKMKSDNKRESDDTSDVSDSETDSDSD